MCITVEKCLVGNPAFTNTPLWILPKDRRRLRGREAVSDVHGSDWDQTSAERAARCLLGRLEPAKGDWPLCP